MGMGLAFGAALGAGMILALMRPGVQTSLVVVPALVFMAGSVALSIALRGRRWPRPTPEDRVIGRDEWVSANINRSRRFALAAVCFGQVPLMLFVAYVQPDPTVGSSVLGMAMLTLVTGNVTFFGSYLLYSRQPADG
jgi:hypothetical protein